MSTSEQPFELELAVRDYECDLQGIVNHSVYLNYMEHARHQFLARCGLDFADLHNRGHSLVLTRCEIDFVAPLKSGDHFVVILTLKRQSRLRFLFEQEIQRLPDRATAIRATAIGTCLSAEGRPGFPEEVEQFFDDLERRLQQ